MRILVTGSCGFLGRNLVDALLSRPNIELYCTARDIDANLPCQIFKADLTDPFDVECLMHWADPVVVIHLAALSSNKFEEWGAELIDNNCRMLINVLDYCKPRTRIVFTSSATVYGELLAQHPDENAALNPISLYGVSKVACEQALKVIASRKRLEYTILRLVANTGKYATHGAVIDIAEKLLKNGDYINLLGEIPGSIKPYMYVKDTIGYIIEAALSWHLTRNIYNISQNNALSIEDMTRILMNKLKVEKKIVWGGNNFQGDNRYVSIDNYNSLKDFKYRPVYNTSEAAILAGLADYLEQKNMVHS